MRIVMHAVAQGLASPRSAGVLLSPSDIQARVSEIRVCLRQTFELQFLPTTAKMRAAAAQSRKR